MNRALSAGIGIALIPGALPQAKMNTAPLALNRYVASAGMIILRRLKEVSQRKNRPPEEQEADSHAKFVSVLEMQPHAGPN